jgi:hypothetical protein
MTLILRSVFALTIRIFMTAFESGALRMDREFHYLVLAVAVTVCTPIR